MSAKDFLPAGKTLPALRRAAGVCRGCDLYKNATQTVFGEGKAGARILFVGEQPGDREDLAGKPFVGPAGRLLDEALVKVDIARSDVYVTNAVKHFKWEPRGKRRMHTKPSAREVSACRPWLEAEISVVAPQVIVCLGATAAQSLLGASFRITRERGRIMPSTWAPWIMATYHPSAILRAPEEAQRDQMRREFIADLGGIVRHLRAH
jgi:DNA polymerase